MKILQICLSGSYNPKMGYQDNILPKYYVKLGYECVTVTSQFYNEKGNVERDNTNKIMLDNDIKLIRIPNKYGLPFKINRFVRLYSGLYKILEEEKPDVIFFHNFQFLSISDVVKYCRKNKNVKVYADSHTDYVNSARNWLSMNILHKIIWRFCVKEIEPYVIKFWGVTEQRCKFMKEIYKVPEGKIDLLVMGADDDKIPFDKHKVRKTIRTSLSISDNEFMIITGGKIDRLKNVHLLIEAVKNISDKKIKLVIFGDINDEIMDTIKPNIDDDKIKYIGWIDSDKVYDYFLASDLGVFPGTHSVLWEQAVGTGLPCIFKRWEGMLHINVGGNCLLIENNNANEIKSLICEAKEEKNYNSMKKIAIEKGIPTFSYTDIAKKSIQLI